MVKRFILILAFILIAAPVFALDGEVSFGLLSDTTLRARPDGGGGVAHYISHVEVGHLLDVPLIEAVRPWVLLETRMDGASQRGFHPTSIRYDAGVDVYLYRGLFISFSHMCWHPVDSWGTIEQYDMVTFGYRWGQDRP